MKLKSILGIYQKSMVILQRLLKHFELETGPFSGLVEVDKTAVVRAKARDTGMIPAKVAQSNYKDTLQEFENMLSCEDADMLTYEESAYKEMFHMRSSASYSVGDYVREWAYTSGIKSICAMMRRGYPGTFQNISLKHLEMHIKELVARHNLREK